jgi:hypothetical protein
MQVDVSFANPNDPTNGVAIVEYLEVSYGWRITDHNRS